MSYKTDEIDRAVLSMLPSEEPMAMGIVDICSRYRLWPGTVRNALKRLFDGGKVQRVWDGNQRFGRYLYWAN
jgi:DNA-binding Lrp family transcriptional regulator